MRAVVCAGAMAAVVTGCASDGERGHAAAARAGTIAPERAGLFAGGAQPGVGDVTRAARLTARSARVHTARGGIVSVRRGARLRLYGRPGGRALAVLGDRTRFGSPAVYSVVSRRPGWLGVMSSLLENGAIGWIRDDPRVLSHGRNRVRIEVDRSERRLDLLLGSRRVMSVAVGVGRRGSETPTGRFAVTDRLSGARYTPSYGCCILALTGSQPRLPAGWRGGDLLAIHGTGGRSAASIASAGCVTVDREPLERLTRTVPLGTVVTIRP